MQCSKCGKIAQPNDHCDWSTTCGRHSTIEPVFRQAMEPVLHWFNSELRKALEPVDSWFDLEGEVGPPMSPMEVVAETAKMLVAERADCLRLRQALQDIVKHQELMGGQMSQLSTTRQIALRALDSK